MKRNIIFVTAVFFVFISCGSQDYPSFKYTNETDKPIQFRTAELDSPLYKLDANVAGNQKISISLSSGVSGRGSIASINESLVTWKYQSGNVYDIRFINKTSYSLTIRNYSSSVIELSENSGLIKPENITVGALISQDPLVPGIKTGNLLYTENPVFKFSNVSNIRWRLERKQDEFILGINPPSGNDWWQE